MMKTFLVNHYKQKVNIKKNRIKLFFLLIIAVTLVRQKSCRREIGFKSSVNILLLCFSFSILTTALNEKGFMFPPMDHNRGFDSSSIWCLCHKLQRHREKPLQARLMAAGCQWDGENSNLYLGTLLGFNNSEKESSSYEFAHPSS